eukprot:gene13447-13573_t
MTTHAARRGGQQATKTSHVVQLAEAAQPGGEVVLIGAHPQLAERIAAAAVEQRLLPLPHHLQGYGSVLKQQTEGSGRFDFVLCYDDGSRLLLEVKNVVFAACPSGRAAPAQAHMTQAHQVVQAAAVVPAAVPSAPAGQTGLFPHGAKQRGSGVVSDRAIKHLHELTQLQECGRDALGRSVRCAVLFVVNSPYHEVDMLFAQMLHRAHQKGVLVIAHDVYWKAGQCQWGKPLPVVFGAGVNGADVDEQHLQKVLEFNATNPRTHWKRTKK